VAKNVPWMLASIPCTLLVADGIASETLSVSPARRCAMARFLGERSREFYLFYELPRLGWAFVAAMRLAVPYAVILIGVLEFLPIGAAQQGFGQLVRWGIDADKSFAVVAVLVYGLLSAVLVGFIAHVAGWLGINEHH